MAHPVCKLPTNTRTVGQRLRMCKIARNFPVYHFSIFQSTHMGADVVFQDTGDSIFLTDSKDVHIQGNVIAFGESNIENHASVNVSIVGNFLLNPLGPNPHGNQVQTCEIFHTANTSLSAASSMKHPAAYMQGETPHLATLKAAAARKAALHEIRVSSAGLAIADVATRNRSYSLANFNSMLS